MLVAVIGARAVSSLVNYFVNRDVVFKARDDHGSFLRYYLLVAVMPMLRCASRNGIFLPMQQNTPISPVNSPGRACIPGCPWQLPSRWAHC